MPAHEEFRDRLEAWAEQQLRPYLNSFDNGRIPPPAKEFNDPIWGTIVLHPIEVVVLDSPVMQRLRTIRQLGVVHLVYTGAEHTRLEHSVGVVSQMDRLIASIDEHMHPDGTQRVISGSDTRMLRMAALCHDVGHGAMSHVSEHALYNFTAVQQIRDDFSEDDAIAAEESVPLSEIASYYIIKSPAFKELLVRAGSCNDIVWHDEDADRIAKAIIGASISDDIPLLHELVSGPFDADKLDYMTRDAAMTGVPVVTDVPRLVQKVRAVQLPPDELPQKIAAAVPGGKAFYVLTGIDQSGGRTLDELMIGRVLLHDKLYRHQKVRACEAMVASILRQIAPLLPDGPAMAGFALTDADLLALTPRKVREVAGSRLGGARQRKRVEIAVRISQMLRERNLFRRAYAFAQDMPMDPYRAVPEHYESLSEIIDRSRNFEFRGDLVSQIASELERLLDHVDDDPRTELGDDLKPYIWWDPPPAPLGSAESARAWLISEYSDRHVLPFGDATNAVSRWSDAYLLTRDLGFVFTVPELARYVYIATEVVLRREHAIRTPMSMMTYAKQKKSEIFEIKNRLAETDYFDGLPHDLKALPPRLSRQDVSNRIDELISNLSAYEGPVGRKIESAEPLLSRKRVLDWLRQFDSSLGDEPLKLLERIRIVSRSDVADSIRAFVEEADGQLDGAAVCPLGSAKDSSSIVTYYANDLHGFRGLTVETLLSALSQERPIIFVDDFIGSGSQSMSIVRDWLGEEPPPGIHETRHEPLSENSKALMRARKIGFVFAAGNPAGATRLIEDCAALGLDATIADIDPNRAPQAFGGNLGAGRRALKDECRRVGSDLLDDGDPRHDEAWRSERALGYGNDAFLVITSYNTPTQTLTCLWKDGVVDGVRWMPLFPRRKKL